MERVASASPSDYDRPVRCAGWRVTELLQHVARAPAAGAGDDSSVLLFALGRIPADEPAVKIVGDEDVARRFKTYLPGP